jgi:hypothetical protein
MHFQISNIGHNARRACAVYYNQYIISTRGNAGSACAFCRRRQFETTVMSKQDEYRKHAADTVGLASRAGSANDKGRLLALAEAWLDLADRAASRQKGKVPELHSLLRSRRSGDRPDADQM